MHVLVRRVAGCGVDGLCRVAGRRQVVRAARFLLHRSRLDVPNDPRTNGEQQLQRWVLAATAPAKPLTVFDVGAHVGAWSGSLLRSAELAGRRLELHAFEPARDTHRMLAANLPATAYLNRLAVSDRPGEVAMHLLGTGAGSNSLHPPDGAAAAVEPVVATTIDDYVTRSGVTHIDLLKIDAEGHDLRALRGAVRSFRNRAVSVAQFEYNHRWVYARHYLKDAFDLLAPLGYRLGKLTPRGIEWYPRWDPELETFVEGNYLACTDRMARRLPQVRWWKEGAAPCTSD